MMYKTNKKGTALIITFAYLVIVAIICIASLIYSVRHYKLMSERVDRMQYVYPTEGGLYLGNLGIRGNIGIGSSDYTYAVNITATVTDATEGERIVSSYSW